MSAVSSIPSIRTIKFWINSFIPKDIPGLTKQAKGVNSGKTFINWSSGKKSDTSNSDCFLTDNRNFDINSAVSSRASSEVTISLGNISPTIIKQTHQCKRPGKIDFENGKLLEEEKIENTSGFKFSDLKIIPPSKIEVLLQGSTRSPLIDKIIPKIEYEGKFGLDWQSKFVYFEGRINEFPAFEAYYSFNDSNIGMELFRYMPQNRTLPKNLYNMPSRSINIIKKFF